MARPAVRDERRAQILDAMYAVMSTRGMSGASISEIAEAAGIARGALHYFFKSKDEITASLMQRLGDRYIAQLDTWLAKRIDACAHDAKLRARLIADVVRWHFRGDEDNTLKHMTVWIDFWGQAASSDTIRDVVVDVQERARGVLKTALTAQRKDLAALSNIAMRPLTAALLALIQGGLLQWRLSAQSTSISLSQTAITDAIGDAASAFAMAIPAPSSPSKIKAA